MVLQLLPRAQFVPNVFSTAFAAAFATTICNDGRKSVFIGCPIDISLFTADVLEENPTKPASATKYN